MVSVLVAVYNVEDYLTRCLESVISQTYKELEIVLVDDGSTDSSGDICEDFAKKDSRVRVIHKENGGLSSARNAGLDAATGDYILMIDGDDALHPQMIEILYNLIKSGDYDFSMCYGVKINDLSYYEKLRKEQVVLDKDNVKELSSDSCMRDLYVSKGDKNLNYAVVWNKLYKRTLINHVRFKSLPEKDVNQDVEYNSRVFQILTKAISCPSQLYYYIQRPSSFQHHGISLRWISAVQTIYICLNEIPRNNKKYRSYCLRRLYLIMYVKRYWSRNTSFSQVAIDNQKRCLNSTIKEFALNPHIPIFDKISLILLNYSSTLSKWWIGTGEWIAKIRCKILQLIK